MRYCAGSMVELSKKWPYQNFLKPWSGAIDAQHCAEEFEVRAGAPGMTVGTRGLGGLSPSGHAAAQLRAPLAQHVEVAVAFSCRGHGRVKIVAEVDSRLG